MAAAVKVVSAAAAAAATGVAQGLGGVRHFVVVRVDFLRQQRHRSLPLPPQSYSKLARSLLTCCVRVQKSSKASVTSSK